MLEASPVIPDAAESDPLQGTSYKTIRRVGRGGMCHVLLAEHCELRKRFVVKILHPEFAHDVRHDKRLRLEAKLLAKLDSPYIVAVSDLGETASGSTYVVMEALNGSTLRDELRRRPDGVMPVAEAIRWTLETLLGLAAAHAAKIIHRDIKLDNLFLCAEAGGQPRRLKVLDFGIAKWLDPAASGMVLEEQPQTELGTFLGTPRFVAPEQASAKAVDERTDLYAVGLVLYQLVAGQGPFAHHTSAVDLLIAQVAEKPPPPSIVAPQAIPAELDAAILTAISKEPRDRFQTAAEFSEVLRGILEALGDDVTVMPEATTQAVHGDPVASDPAEPVSSTAPEATVTAQPRSATAPLPGVETRRRSTAPFPAGAPLGTGPRGTTRMLRPEIPWKAPTRLETDSEASRDSATLVRGTGHESDEEEATTVVQPLAWEPRRPVALVVIWVLVAAGLAWAVFRFIVRT